MQTKLLLLLSQLILLIVVIQFSLALALRPLNNRTPHSLLIILTTRLIHGVSKKTVLSLGNEPERFEIKTNTFLI